MKGEYQDCREKIMLRMRSLCKSLSCGCDPDGMDEEAFIIPRWMKRPVFTAGNVRQPVLH